MVPYVCHMAVCFSPRFAFPGGRAPSQQSWLRPPPAFPVRVRAPLCARPGARAPGGAPTTAQFSLSGSGCTKPEVWFLLAFLVFPRHASARAKRSMLAHVHVKRRYLLLPFLILLLSSSSSFSFCLCFCWQASAKPSAKQKTWL